MAALEQEIASVIRFILDSLPGITPYYWDIPEGFVVPSVFFPQPGSSHLSATRSRPMRWNMTGTSSFRQHGRGRLRKRGSGLERHLRSPPAWSRSLTRREQR